METLENRAASGIEGLDQILCGGFPRGQMCLINGSSGAGKTTLCLQFLMAGARNGEAALYLGTSETKQEIQRIAESHNWSLDGITIHHHVSSLIGEEQTMLHPAEVELPQNIESILSVVDEVAPTRLVIDSLAEMRVLARDEWWYRRQLIALKHHFSNNRCTVLMADIPDGSHSTVFTIVSGMIELEQTSPLYGPDRRRLRVVKMRGQRFSTGHHDFKIRTGGIDVFPRLAAADHRQRFPRELLATGLAEMDAMLCGGLVRGTSTLLLGPSGTGKSLMATQLAVAAAERGERSVMYVFDERVQTLYQRSEGVGLPLQQYVTAGLIQIRQVDPAELTAGEFSDVIKNTIEADEIHLLIIDSLNGYAYAMPEERLLGLYLHELASYLSERAVTSLFTATQHGLISDTVSQPFDVSYIADTVLLFRHFEHSGQVHKAISVYKSRSSAHETTIREFMIDSRGVHVGEPLKNFHGILGGAPLFVGETLHGA